MGIKKETMDLIQTLGINDYVKVYDKYIPNEDIGKYVCASDIAVLPYVHATNSGIVQTLFGFKKPVIVTDVGGLPESVLDNKTGFVVPPKDSTALADAILKFYKEKKEKRFIKGIIQDKDRFSWDRMVENIERFMK